MSFPVTNWLTYKLPARAPLLQAASWLSVSAFASPLPLVVLAARQPIPNEPKADTLLVISGCGNDPQSGTLLPTLGPCVFLDDVSMGPFPLGGRDGPGTPSKKAHRTVSCRCMVRWAGLLNRASRTTLPCAYRHMLPVDAHALVGSWRCCLACEDQPPAFWGRAGAELRGRSSQAVDKKSYNLVGPCPSQRHRIPCQFLSCCCLGNPMTDVPDPRAWTPCLTPLRSCARQEAGLPQQASWACRPTRTGCCTAPPWTGRLYGTRWRTSWPGCKVSTAYCGHEQRAVFACCALSAQSVQQLLACASAETYAVSFKPAQKGKVCHALGFQKTLGGA